MDYFDSGQVSDFSVRDVFESEVKTEIDELLNTETTPFAQETVTNMDLGTGLPSADMGLEITELQAWDHGFNQTVIDGAINTSDITVSSSNNILDFSPDKYGLDSSPNIFVDPQTGLPSTQTTLGGTHIHAHQVNLFVNSGTSQLHQQALLPQQGLNVSSSRPKLDFDQTDGYGLQQFNHVSNGHHQRQREFTHYQLQNGQGQTLVSQRKNGVHRLGAHSPSIKTARHQPYPGSKSHLKKSNISKTIKLEPGVKEKVFPKPCYSYSCLITMALKNSKAGCLPVSEIYHFMCENFPYFKTAKDGWKNSVRHNLSLNKCFAKVETPVSNAKTGKKGCLWAMNPEKAAKMEEEVHKSTKRDPNGIKMSMAKPEDFPKIEALSRLTHPKNLKNSIKVQQRQSSSSQKRVSHPNPHATNNSIKVSSASIKLTTTQKPDVRPVSLKRVNPNASLSQDLFHQDFDLMDSNLPPLAGDLGLQDELTRSLCYDTIEILPFDAPSTTSPIATTLASTVVDTSPFKDNSQSINSSILGLDTSPITTLANAHFNVVEQPKRLAAFM